MAVATIVAVAVAVAVAVSSSSARASGSPTSGAGSAAAAKDPTSHVVDPTGRDIGCSTAVAPAPILTQVDTRFVTGLLEPFGVAFASDSRHLFVDSLFNPSAGRVNSTPYRDDSGVSLYSAHDSALTPLRVGTFPGGSLVGMAVSPNGRTLVAANDSGASVFSVTRRGAAEASRSSWLRGSFVSKGQGAIEVASRLTAIMCLSLSNGAMKWQSST